MAAHLWPLSGTRQLNTSGNVMAGARLYIFDEGTTTPRTVYEESALTTAHDHPIESDAYGMWPAVYIAPGNYRYRILDSEGVSQSVDFDGIIAAATVPDTGLTASAFVQTLLDDADAAAFLTTLGFSAFVQTTIDDTTAANFRTTVGAPQLGITPIVSDTASRDIAATDVGKTLEMTNGSARIYTIRLEADVAMSDDAWMNVVRMGAGSLTIDAVAGVLFNDIDGGSCVISAQYQGASLRRRASNDWAIVGSHSTVT